MLKGRIKWYQSTTIISVGGLVVIEAPNHPPTEWQLRRIREVNQGKYGSVRVVTVQTKDRCLTRPVVKFVKLPVSS